MLTNHRWSLNKKEKKVLQLLGEAWISTGCHNFGLRMHDRIIFQVENEKYKQMANVASGLNGYNLHKRYGLQNQDHFVETEMICEPVTLHGNQNGLIFLQGPSKLLNEKSLKLNAHFLTDNGQLQDDIYTLAAELVQKQDQLLILYQLTQTMRRHFEVQPLFSFVVHTLQNLFQTDFLITLVSSGGLSPIISTYPNNLSLNKYAIQALQELHHKNEALILNRTDLQGVASLLFLPLKIKSPFQASFAFANKNIDTFKTNDLKLAQFVGGQIDAQFEHVQLHQELLAKMRLQAEADMARKVQMQLLPATAPKIPGLDLFAQSKPASQVGGDFYLFMPDAAFPLFILGDVSGKGMPAALLMTMLRSSFQHASRISSQSETITADVLNSANQNMYDDFTAVDMFATAITVAFDPDSRKLSYSNAGHSPVVYCPAEGEPTILPANGPAMGILPVAIAGQDSIILNPDDVFIICTDGFSEAWNNNEEMYGHGRLLNLVSSLREYPALEIAVEIYMAVDNFSQGHEQDDDQTLIVIKGTSNESK